MLSDLSKSSDSPAPLPKPTSTAPENSAWDGSVSQVVDYLKESAKDPDSIKCSAWSKVVQAGDGYLVGCTVRGKNSFGGYDAFYGVFLMNAEGKVLTMERHDLSMNPVHEAP
jgi:hypothetical protein